MNRKENTRPELKFSLRPASPDEAGLIYALPAEQDAELGAVGHVRIDHLEETTPAEAVA